MSEETPADRKRSPDAPCLNCGNTTTGRFCPECGQRKVWVRVSVRAMLADVLEDQLALNRTLPRTVAALLIRPGFLTQEYVRGRIVSYIAPFRLYLVASVVFFLIVSFVGLAALDVRVDADGLTTSVDSARSVLRGRINALADADTADMPEAARRTIRQQLAGLNAALAAIPDTATVLSADQLANVAALSAGGAMADARGRQPWAQNISIEAGDGLFRNAVRRKIDQVDHLPPQEAIRAILEDLLEYAPHMVFVLLPVFALLLKLLYIRRDRYYAEHFVFALHVHAFVFVMMTLMFVLPWDVLNLPILLWIAVYIWLAMKRVYRQGWLRTTLKWWTLGWTYALMLVFGLVGLGLVALLLT